MAALLGANVAEAKYEQVINGYVITKQAMEMETAKQGCRTNTEDITVHVKTSAKLVISLAKNSLDQATATSAHPKDALNLLGDLRLSLQWPYIGRTNQNTPLNPSKHVVVVLQLSMFTTLSKTT